MKYFSIFCPSYVTVHFYISIVHYVLLEFHSFIDIFVIDGNAIIVDLGISLWQTD